MDRPISVVGTRVVQAAVDPDVSIADLAKLAQQDPGFAARVLHLVNSAAFGLRMRVTEIRQACTILGARGLRNVALGLVVSDMVPHGEGVHVLLEIALRRAVAAKLAARALGILPLDEAFTIGLFLEVGLLIEARSDAAMAVHLARMPAMDRPLVERAFGRMPHVLSSSKLAVDLGLPQAMSEAIAHHHDPKPADEKFARVAWLAERIAGAWEAPDPAQGRAFALQSMAVVGLKPDAAEGILEALPQELASAAASIERAITEPVDLAALSANAQSRLLELNHGYEQLVRRLEELLDQKDALARELETANEHLSRLAALDSLTGLANRRAFEDSLRRDMARAARRNEPLSLVMLDVDHFKRLNDTYGHPVGDQVLVQVAQTLRSNVRACDFPARIGGEEFIAILPNANGENGRVVAERIRRALEQIEVLTPKGLVKVTASFGVAAAVAGGTTDELVSRVDAALYSAKQAGRNLVNVAA